MDARVFPRRTSYTPIDDYVFIGEPGLFRPPDHRTRILVSVCFTWDIEIGERIARSWRRYYDNVQIGGPAFGNPGGEFTPGLFVKQGITITSRGCPRSCPWCYVPEREGRIRELDIKPGWIIQDDNFLATSEHHQDRVFEMLKSQTERIRYSGGLDPRLFRDRHRRFVEDLRLDELWFACDTDSVLPALEKAAALVENVNRKRRRCYVMVGYDRESVDAAERRIRRVYDFGLDPFAQFYRGKGEQEKTDEWKSFLDIWSRPGNYHSVIRDERKNELQKSNMIGKGNGKIGKGNPFRK